MTSPTHYLDALVLLAGVFPSGLSYSLSYVLGMHDDTKRQRARFLLVLALPFALLALVLLHFRPGVFALQRPSWLGIGLAAAAIPVVWAAEYAAAAACILVRHRRLGGRMSLHGFWSGRLSLAQHALFVLIAIGEEFVFRKLGFDILGGGFGWGLAATLVATSFLYALNHIFFGLPILAAKFVSGCLYGLLYIFGGSLVLPVLAHLGYNHALLVALGRRRSP
jgi:membrane protease YdiL (CAAX protease family)